MRLFSLRPLIIMSVFMPVLCCFHSSSCVVQFEIDSGDTSSNTFIIQNCFTYPVFFGFRVNLKIVLSIFVKNRVIILVGISLNL